MNKIEIIISSASKKRPEISKKYIENFQLILEEEIFNHPNFNPEIKSKIGFGLILLETKKIEIGNILIGRSFKDDDRIFTEIVINIESLLNAVSGFDFNCRFLNIFLSYYNKKRKKFNKLEFFNNIIINKSFIDLDKILLPAGMNRSAYIEG